MNEDSIRPFLELACDLNDMLIGLKNGPPVDWNAAAFGNSAVILEGILADIRKFQNKESVDANPKLPTYIFMLDKDISHTEANSILTVLKKRFPYANVNVFNGHNVIRLPPESRYA